MGALKTFTQGGVWMYLITLLAIALVVILVLQHRGRARRDLRWLLVGLIATVAVTGPLGSLVGMVQAFGAIEALAPEMRPGALWRAVGIAATPTAWSGLILSIAALPVGFVAARVRKGGE
jgi:hypothetical protein